MDEFLNLPKRTTVREEETVFIPDYKYADNEALKNITVQHLAKLESDLHSLRLLFVANGENPDALISQNRTIGQEMERVQETIKKLEMYFSSIL